jgi:hypothetical protein
VSLLALAFQAYRLAIKSLGKEQEKAILGAATHCGDRRQAPVSVGSSPKISGFRHQFRPCSHKCDWIDTIHVQARSANFPPQAPLESHRPSAFAAI